MIHDPELIDRLGGYPVKKFVGTVYRATGASADPTAASTSGGRWSPADVSVLYTSLERDGALAEVASYLAELTPLPRKPLRVHTLEVSTRRTLRLVVAELSELGVEMDRYGVRDYAVTQQIGAAMNFLEFDGLISPSARWNCENLTLFSANHDFDDWPNVSFSEDVEWQSWAKASGILS